MPYHSNWLMYTFYQVTCYVPLVIHLQPHSNPAGNIKKSCSSILDGVVVDYISLR